MQGCEIMTEEREKHPIFDGYVTNWVFNPTKNCDLDHYELQVYSALAHAQGRNQTPTILALAWRTGINRDTVSRNLDSLENKGFIVDGKAVLKPDAFFEVKSVPKSEHFSKRLRFWKCLVQSAGSPLNVSDLAVLSYLWWSKINTRKKAFTPKHGWSVKYLASVLTLKPATVRQACDRLETMQLLQRTDDAWLTPSELDPWNESWFKRKCEIQRTNAGNGDLIPDMAKLPEKFWPGATIWSGDDAVEDSQPATVEPVLSQDDQCIDWMVVRAFCEGMLAIHGLEAQKDALLRSVRPDIKRLGTTTGDWKKVVANAVAKKVAHVSAEMSAVDSQPAVENEEFLLELQAYEE